MDTKVRENRLRRMAQRQGLALSKSRRRDPYAIDFGDYYLWDPDTNAMVYGEPGRVPLDLDDIEAYLTSDRTATSKTKGRKAK